IVTAGVVLPFDVAVADRQVADDDVVNAGGEEEATEHDLGVRARADDGLVRGDPDLLERAERERALNAADAAAGRRRAGAQLRLGSHGRACGGAAARRAAGERREPDEVERTRVARARASGARAGPAARAAATRGRRRAAGARTARAATAARAARTAARCSAAAARRRAAGAARRCRAALTCPPP